MVFEADAVTDITLASVGRVVGVTSPQLSEMTSLSNTVSLIISTYSHDQIPRGLIINVVVQNFVIYSEGHCKSVWLSFGQVKDLKH